MHSLKKMFCEKILGKLSPLVSKTILNILIVLQPHFRIAAPKTGRFALLCDLDKITEELRVASESGLVITYILVKTEQERNLAQKIKKSIPVFTTREYRQQFNKLPILVSGNLKFFLASSIHLALLGIRYFNYLKNPDYLIKKVKFDKEYANKNSDRIIKCLSMLADSESRKTLLSVVKYRNTGDHGYIRIAKYPEYFHPIVNNKSCNWVIDAGASNGRTSIKFLNNMANETAKVIALEPAISNFDELSKVIDQYPQIIHYPYALGLVGSKVNFDGSKKGSSYALREDQDSSNALSLDCITLEKIIEDENLVGFGLISFDVEGAELPTLKREICFLKSFRPMLQVSLYHEIDDLTKIPQFLSENLKEYIFYMGHHTGKHTETDLYCIPAERIKAPVL